METLTLESDYDINSFELLFNQAIIGIVVFNDQGIIQSVNPYLLEIFGYTMAEVTGNPIEFLIPKRFHNKHIDFRNERADGHKCGPMCLDINLYAIKKNGTVFPVQICFGGYHDNDKKVAIAFISDISTGEQEEEEEGKICDTCEQEKKANQFTGKLAQMNGKHGIPGAGKMKGFVLQKELLNNVPAIIFTVDTEGIIQTFNSEAEKETGYLSEELIGKHTPQIFVDPELLLKRSGWVSKEQEMEIPAGMELFPNHKTNSILLSENEWIYVRKDGTRFPVQLKISPLYTEEGTVYGFISVAVNISSIKKVEHDLFAAFEKEKELNELKSKFVSMASHEFRTPLSTVLSSSYLIGKYTNADDQSKREKHLRRIISSVNMLTDILNDFLNVGKIEEGKIMVKPALFRMDELVSEIIDEINGALKKRQQITYNHVGDQELFMDASLIRHIIMNLVSNAGKFSPEDSFIEIKTINQNNLMSLSVKDHGIGISKEDQKHLMERFYRGGNASNIQGTGLGLHIVSKYVELMKGTVECKSEVGKGTEFIINFNTKEEVYEKNITY